MSASPDTSAAESSADTVTLARGIAANAATLAAISVRAFYSLIIARLLGAATLGGFIVSYAWIDLLSQICVLGLDTATTAYVARRRGMGDSGAAAAIYRRALIASFAVSTLMAGLVVLVAWSGWLPRLIGVEGVELPLAIMALALPAIAVSRISVSVSRGFHVMHHDLWSRGIAGTLAMLVVLLAAIAVGAGPLSPALSVAASFIATAWVAHTAASGLVRRHAPPAHATRSDGAAGLLAFSLPIAGYSVLNMLTQRLDVLLLATYVGHAPGVTLLTLGVYGAAAEVAGSLRKVRQVFDVAYAPIAAHTAGRESGDLRARLAQVARWVLMLVAPAVALTILAGGAALSLYGPGFRAGSTWLSVLALAMASHSLLGLIETTLMVKRPMLNLANSAVAATLQIAVSLVLIPRFGPLGAALGTLAAYAAQACLRFTELRVVEGWGWPWRSQRLPLAATGAGFAAGLAMRLAIGGVRGELAAALAFLLTCIGVIRLAGLTPDDRALLGALRRRD